MTALAAGHLGTDFANGALPALLPFLKDRFSLSYTLAALLMLASTASSSLVQPLFGLWSDRRGAIWLLPTGVAVAGVGIGVAAAMPSYWLGAPPVGGSRPRGPPFPPGGSKYAPPTSRGKPAGGQRAVSHRGGHRLPPPADRP